jgi:3-oxoacyl-[acyl-carrier-protein] synthase-3
MMSVAAPRSASSARHRPQIDCVIVATVTPAPDPAIATAIAYELGTDQAAAFDISAACAVLPRPRAGRPDGAGGASTLVIGVERLSDLTTPDRGTAFIFADGAGAAIVGPSDTPGIGPVVWGSDGEQFDLIRQKEDWRDIIAMDRPVLPYLTMQGNPVFRWASFTMAKVAHQALDKDGISSDDLDVFVHHQANMHGRDGPRHEASRPGADRPYIAEQATLAASIPLALDRMIEGTGTQRGHRAADRVRCRPGVYHQVTQFRTPSRAAQDRNRTTMVTTEKERMATTEEIRADLAEIVNEVAGSPSRTSSSTSPSSTTTSTPCPRSRSSWPPRRSSACPSPTTRKNLKTVGDIISFIENAQADRGACPPYIHPSSTRETQCLTSVSSSPD